MPINNAVIKDYLVFKGEFSIDFCIGINVIIGGNGTGKTTLLKELYKNITTINFHRSLPDVAGKIIFDEGKNILQMDAVKVWSDINEDANVVYIPEKDILEHAKGLVTFIAEKQTGFGMIYSNILIKAQDVPTQNQTAMQKHVGETISKIIGGKVQWVQGDGTFYTIKTDGTRIPFANEASGFKKLGLLGLLVACGQLEGGSILFWDEPENSLNPELMPVLVDILLELQRNGVQIFIATHNYNLARWFDIKSEREKGDKVTFINLSKRKDSGIEWASAIEYSKLPKSVLEDAEKELFKAVVANAMEVQDDE